MVQKFFMTRPTFVNFFMCMHAGNPAAVEDTSTGKIILASCRNNKNVLITESSDDGVNWGNRMDISMMVTLPSWAFVGTGPPGGIQLPSGRLVICMGFALSCCN